MSSLVKHEEKKQQLEHFRALSAIASKGGTSNMSQEVLMNIMLTANDLGISPMKAINGGFYVVNGKISMSTALMADRIRKEGHSIKIPEWTTQKCVMIGVRKDNGDSVKFEFTMEDATAAGLTNSPTWKKFPKQMLYNRAMSTLARTLFPDVVGNSYSEDEKWDIMNVPPEKRPLEDPDIEIESVRQVISVPSKDSPVGNPVETLKELLDIEQIPTEHLQSYLEELAQKKNQPIEHLAGSALMPQLFPKFKDAYSKNLAKRTNSLPEASV